MLYIFDDYTLNHDLYELRYKGERIALEPQVFEVLSYLVQHCDRVISKHELLEHLWPDRHVGDKALVRCIQQARQAINDRREKPQRLQTIHGRGYRFTGVVRQGVPEPSGDTGRLVPPPRSTPAPPPGNSPTSPAAVSRARGLSPSGSPDGERKQVTVVVGVLDNAVGLATRLGDEAMHQVMQEFLALVLQMVQRYEGTITECRGNGFMALFGAPLAHEDHPRRAVGAALELARCLHEIPLEVPLDTPLDICLGLHTGGVVVGLVEEDPQRPYVAVNDVTQLAEYLQQCAAPGAIVIPVGIYPDLSGTPRRPGGRPKTRGGAMQRLNTTVYTVALRALASTAMNGRSDVGTRRRHAWRSSSISRPILTSWNLPICGWSRWTKPSVTRPHG